MNVLPVIDRELRSAARRPATYWGRLWSPLLLLCVVGAILLRESVSGRNASTLGQILFVTLTWFCFLSTLVAGGSILDTLSSERREGTLGLLFLTNLKQYDIVLGKLSHGAIHGFYGLCSAIPILLIPILMGGVSAMEVGRVVLALLNTLWLTLTVCLLASSLFQQQRNAAGAGMLILLSLTLFIPMFGGALFAYLHESRHLEPPLGMLAPFLLPSPACSVVFSFEGVRMIVPRPWPEVGFWASLATVHLLGWVSLISTTVIVGSTWQDRPKTVKQVKLRARFQEWLQGPQWVREAVRAARLNCNPIHWLTCRTRLKPYYVLAVVLLLMAGWMWGVLEWRREWFTAPTAIGFMLATNAFLKLGLAGESGKQLGDDARSGALELMLSTELTVPEILRGQFLTLRRMFGWPVLVVLAFQLFLLATSLRWSTDYLDTRDRVELVLWTTASLVALVPDMLAVGWVVLWASVSARKPGQAGPAAGYAVLGIPWALTLGGFGLAAYLYARVGRAFEPPVWAFVLTLLTLSLVIDVFALRWAHRNLHSQFRLLAARRYVAAPPGALEAWVRRIMGQSQPADAEAPRLARVS